MGPTYEDEEEDEGDVARKALPVRSTPFRNLGGGGSDSDEDGGVDPILELQRKASEALLKRVAFDYAAHDYKELPIKPGIRFYQLLAPRPEGTREEQRRRGGRLKLRMPDTIVCEMDVMHWYYTSADGRAGSDSQAAGALVAVHLERYYAALDATLAPVLSSPPNAPYCIQKFVNFKGKKATIVRCVWEAGKACKAYVISNNIAVDDISTTDFKRRYCTQTGDAGATTVFKLTGRSLGEVAEMTNSIVQYVEQNVTPRPQFAQLVADFMKDAGSQWWFLQVKHFTLTPKCLAHFEARDKGEAHVQTPAEREMVSKDYLLMLTCGCCKTRCSSEELIYELTLKMILETVHHLKSRGIELRWFQLLDASTIIADDKAKFYAPARVCRFCYDLYLTEQKLKRMVTKFAAAIGVPLAFAGTASGGDISLGPLGSFSLSPSAMTTLGTPATPMRSATPSALLAASASGRRSESRALMTPSKPMPAAWEYAFSFGEAVQVAPDDTNFRPANMRLVRFITFLHELYDTPDLVSLFGDGTFYLEYTVFQYTTRIPLELVEGSVVPVHKLRVFHFWADDAGLVEFLERQVKIEIKLFSTVHAKPLSSTSLYLKQFQSGLVSKLDYFQLFSTREMAECGLKATLGFVKLNTVDPSVFEMARHQGVYIPVDPGYFSVDPLPEEWMAIIPNKHGFLESLPDHTRHSQSTRFASSSALAEPAVFGGGGSGVGGASTDASFFVTQLDESDEAQLLAHMSALSAKFASHDYTDAVRERTWLVKLMIHSVVHLSAEPGEQWKVDYSVLGQEFSSPSVLFVSDAAPLEFNTTDDIHLHCSYSGLQVWLDKFPAAVFDVVSRERSAGGTVSIPLAALLQRGKVTGKFKLGSLVGNIAQATKPLYLKVSIFMIDPDDAPEFASMPAEMVMTGASEDHELNAALMQ
ncbi:uncharacterized protein AMSG_08462 [Thecamonas trahens ATCC 50062]|uniref:Uncharacterized protein n=1 Tax=Thecamonas trahens ATCC 50062 TaxID=461836 RepID=A0A0L0DJM0_THETB|nr:hypothetical protein AMSG_08462 [Thecamonas trahens ATCC 50062]KNC52599.1 hypothetical protein AMSG_08462 [Thecamonas trahens ATCC 50062]|eukprot:XP_013755158.1 hypothetical protein AMSG_08462 [Thecamonas trahens ATCC 50062]